MSNERTCPKCGKKMYIRTSVYGKFYTCEDKHCAHIIKPKEDETDTES